MGTVRFLKHWWFAVALLLATSLEGGCKAEPTWPLWSQYAEHFVEGQGRVIDHTGADRTTSEGQAYAMFFALVSNDRSRFDKLLEWTENNLAGGDLTLRLPAWNWGKSSDGQWKVLDANSASDADLWMAYDLIEAGRLWKMPKYENLGKVMVTRILHEEVAHVPCIGDHGGPMLLPAANGFHPEPDIWILNPSYVPLPLLRRMAVLQPGGPWSAMIAEMPQFLGQSSVNGFSMDWVQCKQGQGWMAVSPGAAQQRDHVDGAPSPAPQTPAAAYGSYDAIRVYLWAGIADPGMPWARDIAPSVPGMGMYLRQHVTPPLQVDSSGKVLSGDGPPGFSAAVVPYLEALGLKDLAKAQLSRLEATKDPTSGLYGRGVGYYDQNLAMFCMAWEEQRFRFDKDGYLKVKWK